MPSGGGSARSCAGGGVGSVQGPARRGDGVSSSLADRTASKLGDELAAGEVKPVEILDACLERIDAVEDRVKSFLNLTPDLAHELADDAGGRFAERDQLSAVAGIPLGLKDVLSTRGITTTCGS